MSDDDLYNAFGGADDLYMDDEEDLDDTGDADEGSNRLFIVAVIAMGAILLCAIGAFIVWAAIINPRMQAQVSQAVDTPIVATNTPTTIPTATPTQTPSPTATTTPSPTPTPTQTPVVRTPTTDENGEGGGAGEGAEAGDTAQGEASPTPRRRVTEETTTQTQATSTPRTTASSSNTSSQTPKSGLGEVVLIIGAVLLLGVLFTARKLRQA